MKFTPHTDKQVKEMLQAIGVSDIEDLFADIPEEARVRGLLEIGEPLSEQEVTEIMRSLAKANKTVSDVTSFLGAGAYDHFCPAVIHHILERGEFLTSYTPYQPELSQGTLQAQFEYQSMVAGLLGMDVANASMYEGATALAEACLLAKRWTRKGKVLVSRTVHPEYRQVLETYLGKDFVNEVGFASDGQTDKDALFSLDTKDVACIVIQSPNFFGVVEDIKSFADFAHDKGCLLVATFTEPLAFGLIESPGALGADIAAGEGQSFGIPLSFGGPYVGLFACKKEFLKTMPGRLVGITVDKQGRECYVLTLAAREQHIRRANATSNICTNEGLCAIAVAIYLSLLGEDGLRMLAEYNHLHAERLKKALRDAGIKIAFSAPTFNEFVVDLNKDATEICDQLKEEGIVAGLPLARFYKDLKSYLLITVTEKTRQKDFDRLINALKKACT
jgi:glycine dehydrogenase subunit 1